MSCTSQASIHAPQASPVLGFTGQPRDPLTGWYHLGNGHRTYNPVLMRFHSADRLSPFAQGGVNPYVYCLGDPVNHSDPTGQAAQFVGPTLGILGNGLSLFSTTLKGRALYKVHKTYRAEQGVGGSRRGSLATGTIDNQPERKSKFEISLSVLSGVSGLTGMVTSIMRFFDKDDNAMYIGFAATAISLLTTGYEIYSLIGARPWERYPIDQAHARYMNRPSSVTFSTHGGSIREGSRTNVAARVRIRPCP